MPKKYDGPTDLDAYNSLCCIRVILFFFLVECGIALFIYLLWLMAN